MSIAALNVTANPISPVQNENIHWSKHACNILLPDLMTAKQVKIMYINMIQKGNRKREKEINTYWMPFYCKPLEIIVSRCAFHYKNRCRWYCSHRRLTTQPNFQCGNYWNTQPKQPNTSFTWSNKKSIRELHIYCIHSNFVKSQYHSVAQCSSHVITFDDFLFLFDDIVFEFCWKWISKTKSCWMFEYINKWKHFT